MTCAGPKITRTRTVVPLSDPPTPLVDLRVRQPVGCHGLSVPTGPDQT